MVSIVLVSHSAKLAEGVRELAEQMVQGKVTLAAAGGIDDPANPIGTDALKVLEAIQSVFSDDGVLVLMDLGSALLSAETALEFLPPEQQENVRLCAAPFVEGALAAAVQASVGGSLEQVCREALGALGAKQQQLPGEMVLPEAADQPSEPAGSEIQLKILNRLGLHARPAAQFVSTANRFSADISVRKGHQTANAKSINQIATLGARQGDRIVVTASGPDADAALAALQDLVASSFGETEEALESAVSVAASEVNVTAGAEGEYVGIAASPGVAVGPAVQYRPRLPEIMTREAESPTVEWRRLQAAISSARQEIATLQEKTERLSGEAEAAIFAAHALFLRDPALLDAVKDRIRRENINAEAAWKQEVEATADQYRAIEDDYMRARAADVLDVGQRVLRHLLGVEPPALDFEEPSILLAADLTPSDTAQLEPSRVLGICTEMGGATSHSAILARALGIPAIVGLGPVLQTVADGKIVALDGGSGRLWLSPDENQLVALSDQRTAWLAEQEEAKRAGKALAVTADGQRVEVAANIGGLHDIEVALEYGAEGVGLFRTEFLFLERETAPTEEEQYRAYRTVAEAMGERPVIIRTLDVGGDKPIPYLDLAEELNPFLGWRGIRFCLDRPDVFMPQLRAILRAGHDRNVKIMFPMVSTVHEVRAAKALLEQAGAQLRESGTAFYEQMEIGIMIEVPAAVAVADQLAAEVDFFSIGTNDLSQYVMAADRGNPKVSRLTDALQPAVLRLVQQTVRTAHAAGIWVGMCGELAGSALASPVLLGLGLDELSMNGPAIPAVKRAIHQLTTERAEQIAVAALAYDSGEAVRRFLQTQEGDGS